jgi:hypothetical protein
MQCICISLLHELTTKTWGKYKCGVPNAGPTVITTSMMAQDVNEKFMVE